MKINFPQINQFYSYSSPVLATRKKYNYDKTLQEDVFERQIPSFEGKLNTATQNFQIKNIKNLRCPVCGLIMLNEGQIFQFTEDIARKQGSELALALEKYEDDSIFTKTRTDEKRGIYRPQKQEIVEVIKKIAPKYPNLNLAQLVQMEAKKRIDDLIAIQLKIVDELKDYMKNCNASREEKQNIEEIIKEYTAQIKGESEVQFARKKFIYCLSDTVGDKTTQAKIIQIISKLPSSNDEINSFFIKYAKNKKSNVIANKLVAQSIPSAEHLIPKSKQGPNSIDNYICDCSYCNSQRGDLSFYEWQHTIADFKKNLQEYLEEVQNAIDTRLLDDKYDDYVINIIEKIRVLSNNEILLDLPESYSNEKRRKLLSYRKNEIEKVKKRIKELSNKKKEIKKEIESLEKHPQFHNTVQFQIMSNEIKQLKKQLSKIDPKTQPENAEEINSKISKLQRKIDLVTYYIVLPEDLDRNIQEVSSLIKKMDSIKKEIEKLENQTSAYNENIQKCQALIQQNHYLEALNNGILIDTNFNAGAYDEYYKYVHQEELKGTAQDMLNNIHLFGNKRTAILNKEVINIAKDTIEQTLTQMLSSDSVNYFINESKIKENKKIIKKLNEQIKLMQNKKSQICDLVLQMGQVSDGKTYSEMQFERERLLREKETIKKIQNISQLRSDLDNIKDAILYNKEILTRLEDWVNMSNDMFTKLISIVY